MLEAQESVQLLSHLWEFVAGCQDISSHIIEVMRIHVVQRFPCWLSSGIGKWELPVVTV